MDWLPGLTGAPSRRLLKAGFDVRIQGASLAVVPEGELRLLDTGHGMCFYFESDAVADRVCPGGRGWLATTGLTLELRVWNTPRGAFLAISPFGRVHVGQAEDWTDGYRFNQDEPPTAVRPASGVRGWQVGVEVRSGW